MRQDKAGGMNVLNWDGIIFSGSGNHLGPGRKDCGPSVELKVMRADSCFAGKSMGTENSGIFPSEHI